MFRKQIIVRIKTIKNNIFKFFKNSKITPKHPKNKSAKNLKNSMKEASNKKCSENKLWIEFKNIKNDMYKNFKRSTMNNIKNNIFEN